jgi:mannosyl-3-phosphoglycerate phosphatase
MIKQYLIFTDMDGTLLDHHSYSFEPALTTLSSLADKGIDVIPNTSKTFSELQILRNNIGLTSPFIVENGAAVFIPQGYFPEQPEGTEIYQGYWVKAFCNKREYWLSLLEQKASDYQLAYLGFSAMSDEQISLETGLSVNDAHLANSRLFSEPLKWIGTEEQKAAFKIKMRAAGANVLQGGRFVHISGLCNKGLAMNWLTKVYAQFRPNQSLRNIALGDSYNDNDMLESADIAVQIKSPKHDFPQLFRTDNLWQSQHTGPRGWAECLEQILDLKKGANHG